jgi:UDP-N-acetylmuramoylalanine-D-glutamate ligase
METYRALKLRMFESMQPGSTAILPFRFPHRQSSGQARVGKNAPEFSIRLRQGASARQEGWKTFGTEHEADFRYEDGVVFFENQSVGLRNTYFSNDVLGPAAAAVVAVAEACGVPQGAVTASARQFEPLPHRMERVAEIQGVTFIDDSKATNLAGMCAALRMSSGRIHLIAGGRAKETELSFAKDLLAQQVSRLYLIGEASGAMQTAWADSVECLSCETLERAVFAAWESAEAGDTVLLSPACTSFDQFRSFSERGELFAREVDRLKSKQVEVAE